MRSVPRLSIAGAGLSVVLAAPCLFAQEPTGASLPESADTSAKTNGDVSPPVVKTHPEAPYPPDALRDRVEGSVGVEVTIDETGRVIDARVTRGAGHGFDEAALAAVRQWTF